MEVIGELLVKLALFNLFVEFLVAYVIYPMYKKHGWFKRFYHDVRGYHVPIDGTILECGRYKLERRAICKYCGKEIKQTWEGVWE